jgi:predicted AAA+ superfamily ATPase
MNAKAPLDEYLIFGGSSPDLVKDRVENDILPELMQGLDTSQRTCFMEVLHILAGRLGMIHRISALSKSLAISKTSIELYLDRMEKSSLLHRINPYYCDSEKEISTFPQYYFNDLGVRNYLHGTLTPSLPEHEMNYLFSNYVFLMLKNMLHDTSANIHYWQTHTKAQIAFVLVQGQDTLPIEASYSNISKPLLTLSMKAYLSLYRPKKAIIVHLGEHFTILEDNTQVCWIPFDEFPKLGQGDGSHNIF